MSVPGSRFDRREHMLWAICSSLPPSAVVNGECSNVTCASAKSLLADLTLETLKPPVQGLLENISPNPQAAAPKMLGTEFHLAPKRPFFVGVRIFSKKASLKDQTTIAFWT